MHDLIIYNDEGNPFGVRIVREGDCYGLDDCLTYDETDDHFRAGDPMIEFYDMRFASEFTGRHSFGPRGQFVSRYHRSTLMGSDGRYGLNLYGGVPAWRIDAEAMQQVFRLLTSTFQAELDRLREEQRT